jgi:hypothetical protein
MRIRVKISVEYSNVDVFGFYFILLGYIPYSESEFAKSCVHNIKSVKPLTLILTAWEFKKPFL